MRKPTETIVVTALSNDDTVSRDQLEAALVILKERPRQGSTETLPMLVNKTETARLLGISLSSVFRLVRDKHLTPVQLHGGRRYRTAEIEELARNGRK